MVEPSGTAFRDLQGHFLWVEAAATLDAAKARVKELMRAQPAEYLILSRRTGHKIFLRPGDLEWSTVSCMTFRRNPQKQQPSSRETGHSRSSSQTAIFESGTVRPLIYAELTRLRRGFPVSHTSVGLQVIQCTSAGFSVFRIPAHSYKR